MKGIEEHIRKAMEEGQFKQLPGEGKPLNLDENPLEDPEWRMAHHMLKNSGFSLPWIEVRKEIESELESARSDLRRARGWVLSAQVMKKPATLVDAEWNRAVSAFRKRAEGINKKILSYNLQTPSIQLQLLALDADREIQKILDGE